MLQEFIFQLRLLYMISCPSFFLTTQIGSKGLDWVAVPFASKQNKPQWFWFSRRGQTVIIVSPTQADELGILRNWTSPSEDQFTYLSLGEAIRSLFASFKANEPSASRPWDFTFGVGSRDFLHQKVFPHLCQIKFMAATVATIIILSLFWRSANLFANFCI